MGRCREASIYDVPFKIPESEKSSKGSKAKSATLFQREPDKQVNNLATGEMYRDMVGQCLSKKPILSKV
jgi:hypothetical protein